MQTINITALRHSAFYTPLLFTIQGGFLQQQGLEPHYQPASQGQSVTSLLENDEYHVSQLAVAAGFSSLENGQHSNLRHFAQINQKDGFFISSRTPLEDFQWSDLIGKQVLIDHLFQPLATFRFLLHQHNINENDITIIDAGSVNEMDSSFRNGIADFIHQQGPAPQQLEKDGIAFKVASIGEALGPIAFSSLCASQNWLKTDMAQAFKTAYQQACSTLVHTSAKELAKSVSVFFQDTELSVLQNTIQHYQQLGCWSSEIAINDASYEKLLDVFEFNGLISKRYDKNLLVSD